jgi:hypothetical protein
MTIYLWNGRPVAYLDPDRMEGRFSVYGFNGTHLGWYDKGVIWDDEGDAMLRYEGTLTISRNRAVRTLQAVSALPTFLLPIFRSLNRGALLGLGVR